ncbi:MAG: P-loop NTPase [Candidatus Hadarchaeia archaeon]
MTSGKGGVGKTTLASNLGVVLSEMDKEILLVDADLPSGNLAYYLNQNELKNTLTEFLAGSANNIEEGVTKIDDNLSLLAPNSSLEGFLKSDIEKLGTHLPSLSEKYDLTIIDCPPGISKNSLTPMEISDQIVIVITPDEASVSAGENIEKIGRLTEVEIKGHILNRWKKRSFLSRLFSDDTQMGEERIEERMTSKRLGNIPEEDAVRESTEKGKPVIHYAKNSEASKAIKEIGKKL